MMQKRHKSQTLVIKATQGLRGRRTTLGFRQDKKTGDEIRRHRKCRRVNRGEEKTNCMLKCLLRDLRFEVGWWGWWSL